MDAAEFCPVEVRDQALAVIAATLGRTPQLHERFADFPQLLTVQALIALEEAFSIPLDADDVLPDGTISSACILVQARVFLGRRLHGDDGPHGKPSNLVDLADFRAQLPVERRKMLRANAERQASTMRPMSAAPPQTEQPAMPPPAVEIQDEWPTPAPRARRAHLRLHIAAGALAVLAVAIILAVGVARDLGRTFAGFGR